MPTRRPDIVTLTAPSHARGFSLIEIAIALIILGLIITPIIETYEQQAVDNRILGTNNNLNGVTLALQTYYSHANALPCPADPTLAEGSANYGKQDCSATVAPNAALRVGAVPFVDLHIPAATTLDAWQNKIAYTMVVADATSPLVATNNIIKVENLLVDGTVNPIGNKQVHYVLVSYGDDGLGGYTAAGKKVGNCPAYGFAEHVNCSGGGVVINSTYARSMVPGTNYYDDLVAFNDNLSPGIWTYIPPPTSGITDPYSAIWSQSYIGIGTTTPATYLDVAGDVKIQGNVSNTSSATSTNICNASGGHCFSTSIIAGTGMGAGPSQASTTGCVQAAGGGTIATAMTAVRGGDAACAVETGIVAHCAGCAGGTTCPAGQFVKGIDASGSMTCASP